MRTIRLYFAVLLLAVALATFAAAGARAQQQTGTQTAGAPALPSNAELLAIAKQRVEEKRSAGIVIGVIEPDGHKGIVAYGDAGPWQPALDGDSVFEIGSISKVFTATLLSQMVQEGKVRLDDPVQRWLPSTVTLPTRNGKAITLASLSEQNSGLPRLPDNVKPTDPSNPYADYTVQQMYEFLSHYQLTRDPGTQFEYSNLGVGLLGHALALAAGKTYEELARERIWAPLGMTHTAITFDPWMRAHLALGHGGKGEVVPNWDIPVLAGAGGIRSNMNDMLKFLDANLHSERGPLEKAMAFAQEERADANRLRIGLNWVVIHAGTPYPGCFLTPPECMGAFRKNVVWHDGQTGGYRAFIGFEPSQMIGVIVLSNSNGDIDDIGFHLLDSTFPLASKP